MESSGDLPPLIIESGLASRPCPGAMDPPPLNGFPPCLGCALLVCGMFGFFEAVSNFGGAGARPTPWTPAAGWPSLLFLSRSVCKVKGFLLGPVETALGPRSLWFRISPFFCIYTFLEPFLGN